MGRKASKSFRLSGLTLVFVLDCYVSVAYVGLNAVVLHCVTCSITYITGDLHIEQMSRLHDRTSQMQQVTE